MELLLDRSSPLAWIFVLVVLVSGLACAWIGVRDGLVRRELRTSGGLLAGGKAVAAGLVYLAFGLAGLGGAVVFLLRR
jgi:hypothetical protein